MTNIEPPASWQWQIPEFFNIGDACTKPGRDPEYQARIALTIDHGDSRVQQLNYQQLETRARCFASAVLALGLARHQRLMIRLPNSLEYPIAFMGTLLAGAIAVPASTQLSAEEVAYLCTDADVSVLLINHQELMALQPIVASLPSLRHIIVTDLPGGDASHYQLENAAADRIAVHSWTQLLRDAEYLQVCCQTKADDPAYLVYTSGSTGFPKGVLHAHRALLGRQPSSEYWFDFDADDRILHSGKLNWTYALGTAMMDPFYRGKSVVLYEGPASSDIWPQLIAKHRCTIFIGVPTVYRQILHKTAYGAGDVPSLRYCMSAGEHLSDEILGLWRQRFAQDIYEAVGMSECSYYLSHHPCRPLRAGSAGVPQPGHDIALLDATMQPVADNVEGMLCIPTSDPGLFIEYWGLADETANSRRAGYFLTGDYARRDSDGYLWFLGRKDDIINSMGYRISPIEIERVLKAMPGVADCVVIDEAIDSDRSIVSACIIQAENQPLQADQVIAYAAEHLASYKVPKKIRFMASFARTSNGKVLRRGVKASLDLP